MIIVPSSPAEIQEGLEELAQRQRSFDLWLRQAQQRPLDGPARMKKLVRDPASGLVTRMEDLALSS